MSKPRKNRIYLTGFMGSGKSTLAPILANTLGYTHFDIDSEIEKAAGRTISEIFTDQGEEYFRQLERTLLERLSHEEGCVISLGGGTVANEMNLRLVKSSGVLVYLKADIDQILRRMRHKTDRPLLRSADGGQLSETELRARISQLMTEREPYYAQADLTIVTDERRVGTTVDEIVRAVSHLIL